MTDYKEGLKQHIEKLFKRAQQIIKDRSGDIGCNRKSHKNFLSYYCRYKKENIKKNRYKNTWRDVISPKPINSGFRDIKRIPKNPSIKELENIIEFFEKELEKLDTDSPYKIFKLMYQTQRYEAMYTQLPIITATQRYAVNGSKGKSYGSVFSIPVFKNINISN